MKLREVSMPENIPGQLFLSHMPGRNEELNKALEVIRQARISVIVCLNPLHEIDLKSPEYAKAIINKRLDFAWKHFPLFDFGVPNDKEAFISLVNSITDRLRNGDRILIHCAGGIGRTATLAISVLIALGIEISTAQSIIRNAGAMMQSKVQKEFINWFNRRINNRKIAQKNSPI